MEVFLLFLMKTIIWRKSGFLVGIWNKKASLILLVTVQEVGKELWVLIIVKMFVLWNIHHSHVSRHEKLTCMRRQSDVKIEHFLFISVVT